MRTLHLSANINKTTNKNKPKIENNSPGIVATTILNTALLSSLPKMAHSLLSSTAILLYPLGTGSRTSEDVKICHAQIPYLCMWLMCTLLHTLRQPEVTYNIYCNLNTVCIVILL